MGDKEIYKTNEDGTLIGRFEPPHRVCHKCGKGGDGRVIYIVFNQAVCGYCLGKSEDKDGKQD